MLNFTQYIPAACYIMHTLVSELLLLKSLSLFPFQVVKLMKPIVAASSHVLCNKSIDQGERHD